MDFYISPDKSYLIGIDGAGIFHTFNRLDQKLPMSRELAEPKIKGDRKVKCCSICDKPGHTAKTHDRHIKPEPDGEQLSEREKSEVLDLLEDGVSALGIAQHLNINLHEAKRRIKLAQP